MKEKVFKILTHQLDILIYLLVVPFAVFGLFPYFLLQLQYRFGIPVVQQGLLPLVGIIVIDVGVMLALWCIAILVVYKKGSLHPFAQPHSFIVKGPYRLVLHPMLLASHIILFGEILFLQSPFLLVWLAVWMRFAHLYAVRFKEPFYTAVFGRMYYDHWKRTPRWVPSLRPGRRR